MGGDLAGRCPVLSLEQSGAIRTELRTARVRLGLPFGFMGILCLSATPAASPGAEQSGKQVI